jgi:hypothetical protein
VWRPFRANRYTPKKYCDWVDYLGVWIALATLIVASCAAIGAGFAAYFTYRQWDTATRTLEAAVRPYLKVDFLPDSFAMQRHPNGGGQVMSIQFTIENTGKLPAPARVQAGVAWESRTHTRAPNEPAGTNNVGQRYLFPKQESGRFTAYSKDLTAGDLAQLRANDFRRLLVAVWIGYGEFPNSASREIRACTVYQIEGPFEAMRLGIGEPCPDNYPNEPKNFAN